MARLKLRLRDIQKGSIPGVCMRCGKPATCSEVLKFNRPGETSGGIAIGGLLYLFIVTVTQLIWAYGTIRSMKVRLLFSRGHRFHFFWRRWLLRIIFVSIVSGLVFGLSGSDDFHHDVDLWCFILLLGWLALWVILEATAIRVHKIDAYTITLDGLNSRFVQSYEAMQASERPDEKPFWT